MAEVDVEVVVVEVGGDLVLVVLDVVLRSYENKIVKDGVGGGRKNLPASSKRASFHHCSSGSSSSHHCSSRNPLF